MILSGIEIMKQIGKGNINISPFDENKVGPNSVNLTLHNELKIYKDPILDCKLKHYTMTQKIPDEGFILQPGILYLGRTCEITSTDSFVPMIEGRSSIGRLGISVHVSAGFGDIGFNGFWTLEITCVHPVKIYPNIEICQIFYHKILGDFDLYKGKYQNNIDIQESKMFEEMIPIGTEVITSKGQGKIVSKVGPHFYVQFKAKDGHLYKLPYLFSELKQVP